MSGNYFEDLKNQAGKNKVLLTVIGGLLVVNLVAIKSLVAVSSNKTVNIQVPQLMEPGSYMIDSTTASEKVFKMWTKLWVQELSNFSYKDVRVKITNVMDYLDPATAFKNKAELISFIEFVETNYITQSFQINPATFRFTDLKNGYYKISWAGDLKREIGMEVDKLSNLEYKYSFICFVKNGQIFIKNMTMDLNRPGDPAIKKVLEENTYINYEIYESEKQKLKREQAEKMKAAKLEKEKLKEQGE